MIVIGTVFGIPITLFLVYFAVVRPLVRTLNATSSSTRVGRAWSTFTTIFGIAFLAILGLVVFVILASIMLAFLYRLP